MTDTIIPLAKAHHIWRLIDRAGIDAKITTPLGYYNEAFVEVDNGPRIKVNKRRPWFVGPEVDGRYTQPITDDVDAVVAYIKEEMGVPWTR